MINGFNEIGRLYDENGTYGDWWDRDSEQKFYEQKQCYEYQYQNLNNSLKGLSFKTRLALIKRVITDSGAFRQAIRAYKSYVIRNGHELHLVGFDYSPEQLFWINAANTMCWKQVENDIIDISPHKIAKYRLKLNLYQYYETLH